MSGGSQDARMAHRASPVAAESHVRSLDTMAGVKRSRANTESGHALGSVAPQGAGPAETSGGDTFLDSIIRSKVQPSPVRTQTLTRDRLLDWLTHHLPERLKLITAEAGYGKTTLMADFSRREVVRCLWYKLETSDGEWVTFVNYLIAAGRQVLPDFAPTTAGLLRQVAEIGASRDVIVGSLISELPQLGKAPILLILDDFHLVDESEDVQAIVNRLLEHAPAGFTILISSRRAPNLRLGRLRARGEVSGLSTDDLRFLTAETQELFASTYGHPLEPDLLREVDARTEGWGASLQLVYSSIRSRRPEDVREFIHSMSGAEGSLYDFLAEEVLGHLSEGLQRFVTEASILRRIVPAFAAAALSKDSRATGLLPNVLGWIDEAEEMGLLGRSSVTSISRRFHPLLRDFLLRRLDGSTTPAERRGMHLRVARAAASNDWITACHHLIEAEEHVEAMRVLSDSAADALGTGSLGSATELLPRIKGVPTPPAVLAMQARSLAVTDPTQALALLGSIDLDAVPTAVRALVRLIRTYALFRSGEKQDLQAQLDEILDDATTPVALRAIAQAHKTMLATSHGRATLREGTEALASLAAAQVELGHHHYAAISFHNALVCALAQGDYRQAMTFGDAAIREFKATSPVSPEVQSTHAGLFAAAAELRLAERTLYERSQATDVESRGDADAYAEAATTLACVGDQAAALEMLSEARRGSTDGRTDLTTGPALLWASSICYLSSGDPISALRLLEGGYQQDVFEIGYAAMYSTRLALAAATAGNANALALANDAVATTRQQGSRRFETRARLVRAVALEDGVELRAAIAEAARLGELALLETADALGRIMGHLDPVPEEVVASIQAYPGRWLPVLRRELATGTPASSLASARLLVRFGTAADVPRIVAYEQSNRKRLKGSRLTRALLERVSPRLYVRDLSRVRFDIDGRRVPLTDTRRKSASLLIYLITRPNSTATREQVLDELWPDSDPSAGANSLHQTLYFLRRDIDPWYDDEESANYVVYESEMVWLDASLVQSDSQVFMTEATKLSIGLVDIARCVEAVESYAGRFAPEFEYDEWALSWRDRLHAAYLALAMVTVKRLCGDGRFAEASRVCSLALAIDATALDLEQTLVWVYSAMGATSAAAEQYAHFARAYQLDVGAEPPPLASLQRPSLLDA